MLQLPQLPRWLARYPSRRDADGSTPGTARGRALIAASHRTGCRARLARLGYQTFYVFYSRYIESWVTEINLQAMLGTANGRARFDWPTYSAVV